MISIERSWDFIRERNLEDIRKLARERILGTDAISLGSGHSTEPTEDLIIQLLNNPKLGQEKRDAVLKGCIDVYRRVREWLDELYWLEEVNKWQDVIVRLCRVVDMAEPLELRRHAKILLTQLLEEEDCPGELLGASVRAYMAFEQKESSVRFWEEEILSNRDVAAYGFNALLDIDPMHPRIIRYLCDLWHLQMEKGWTIDTAFLMHRSLTMSKNEDIIYSVLVKLEGEKCWNKIEIDLRRRDWSKEWLVKIPEWKRVSGYGSFLYHRPVDGKENEWMGENSIYRQLKLENYFRYIRDSDDLLDALYVENTNGKGLVGDFEPVIHKAYRGVLATKGIHTPDGEIEIQIPEPSGDIDCSYLAEFILQALKLNGEKRIRYKRSSKRLLVVLGGVGEGKTTLLDYFFRIFLKGKKEDHNNIVRLNIDFEAMSGIEPSRFNEKYIAGLLLEEINKQFPRLSDDKNKLRAVFEEPLSLQRGVLDLIEENSGIEARRRREAALITDYAQNPLLKVASIINYLTQNENKKIVVTLDNVDRLPGVQTQSRAVSLIRLALRQWDCCSIICVREYTYGHLWSLSEWGFERPLLYHKRPPTFAPLLARRFEKFPIEKYLKPPCFISHNKVVEIEDIKRFVTNISNFLWTRYMENSLFRLSNGSVRHMLNMVRKFLSFQKLELEPLFLATFLKSQKEAEKIRGLTANFDNFIRAITVGNYRYYSSLNPLSGEAQETFILNVLGGPRSMPLLPYRILTYIRGLEIVDKEELIEKACRMDVRKDDVKNALESFLKSYLIESVEGINLQDIKQFVITRKGIYYFDVLVILARYIENVINDTWWDKKIEPYDQNWTLSKEFDFLEESVKFIFRIEMMEAQRVPKECWSAYNEFLYREPYCERLGASILKYLGGLKARDAKLPKKIFDRFELLLEGIHEAKRNERLVYRDSRTI